VANVQSEIVVPGPIHEVEAFWYDTSRWPTWVDGLAHIDRVQDRWPTAGGKVVWDSTPAGRGRVVERVVAHEPGVGQELEVEDAKILGRQRLTFTEGEDAVRIHLSFSYRIKKRNPFTPLFDLLFVRRVFATNVHNTLRRFAVELEAERELRAEKG
jgi:hypothetical protein